MDEHNAEPIQMHQHDDLSYCIMFADFNGCTVGDLIDALSTLSRDDEIVRLEPRFYNPDDLDEGVSAVPG